MPKSRPAPSKPGVAVWTPERSAALISAMKDLKVHGQMSENGLKSSAWQSACDVVNRTTNASYTPKQCQTHYKYLKDRFKICHKLHTESGFGWCEVTSMLQADDAVWAKYKPGSKELWFRVHPFPLYRDIAEITGQTIATGEFAVAAGAIGTARSEQTAASSVQPSQDDVHGEEMSLENESQVSRDSAESQMASQSDTPPPPSQTPSATADELDWQSFTTSSSASSQPKRQRISGAAALDKLATTLEKVVTDVLMPPSTPSAPTVTSTTTTTSSSGGCTRRQLARDIIFSEEKLSPQMASKVPYLLRNEALVEDYLGFPENQLEARTIWLENELASL